MADIERLLKKMTDAEIEVPDYLYENISRNIRQLREKRKKMFIRVSVPRMFFRYALAFSLFCVTGLAYFHSIRIPVKVIREKGEITVSSAAGEWRELEGGTAAPGWYRTGEESGILIQLGRTLTVKLTGENHFKIKKMRRFLRYENYEIYMKKGNQAYALTGRNTRFVITTDDLELRHIGTKFSITADRTGTRAGVSQGRVAVKRHLRNREKAGDFQFKDDLSKKSFLSAFQAETVLTPGDSVDVDKKENERIESLIDKIAGRKMMAGEKDLDEIKKAVLIRRRAEKRAAGWRHDAQSPVWASPSLGGNGLYFGTEDGQIVSLSEDGKLNWKIKSGASFLNRGTVYGNRYYIVDSKGFLYAVNTLRPEIEWKIHTGKGMYSAPLIKYGKLFVATTSGKIIMLHPETGKTEWQIKIKSGIFSEPVVENGKIYCGSMDGTVTCIDYRRSAIEWEISTKARIAVSSPVIHGNILFIANNRGTLYAIDKKRGTILWKKELADKILSRPEIAGNALIVSTARGTLISMDLKGQIRWKLRLRDSIETSFGMAGSRIIVPTRQGNVYVIDRETGSINKTVKLHNDVSTPVVKDGFIYLSALSGRIYRIK